MTAARRTPDFTLLLRATLFYAVLSTVMSFESNAFLEADGVTHYLYSRFAFEVPAYFVDVWARPVRMLIHAVPAHFFGLHGVRAASLVCAIATAWLTYAIAKQLKWSRPGLAGFFVLAQPLFFMHSFSELTEVPFALLAAGAFLAMAKRSWPAFALICGTMPASRPEGIAFVMLAIAMLVLHRRWRWLPLVFVPLLVWNTVGWWLYGSASGPWHRWLIDHIPYSSHSLYPSGRITRFLEVLPTVVSPLAVPAVLLGTVALFRRERVTLHAERPTGDETSPRNPVTLDYESPRTSIIRWHLPDAWLIALIPWGILSVHSLLYVSGRMSSSGEPRYLLAATPFWALLAAYGWTRFAERFQWRRPELLAALAALVPVLANGAWQVAPLREQPDALLAREIVKWYRTSDVARTHPNLYATNPLVLFEADRLPQGTTSETVDRRPPGSIFVYDSLYSSFNADPRMLITPERFDAAGWKRSPTHFYLPNQTWIVFVSE